MAGIAPTQQPDTFYRAGESMADYQARNTTPVSPTAVPAAKPIVYGPQTGSPEGNALENSQKSPTVGDLYGGANLDDALSKAEAARTASYDPNALAQGETQTRSDVLKSYQSQLDSLDQAAAEARARITTTFAPVAAGRVGGATAMESRRGLLGSDFGQAQTDTVNKANAEELSGKIQASDAQYANQKFALQQFITGEADKEIALRQDASQKGADAKIAEIQGRTARAQASAQASIKAMIAAGVTDPANPNYAPNISSIVSNTGLSKDEVVGYFSDAKKAADAATIKGQSDAADLASKKAGTAKTEAETMQIPIKAAQDAAKNISDINLQKSQIAKNYADAAKAKSDVVAGAGGSVAGTTGKNTIDATVDGYATKAVAGAGGLTQSAIDQGAMYMVLHGGAMPPGIGLASTGLGGQKKNAIANRAGEMAAGMNVATNPTQLAALSGTLNKQTEYQATVTRSLGSADAGFKQVIDTFKNKGINQHELPIANIIENATKYQLSPGDLQAFRAGLTEVSNEYSQVFSRGGQVDQNTRDKADKIANGDLSLTDLQKTYDELQAQGKIVLGSTKDTISGINDQINKLMSPDSSTSSSGTFDSSAAQKKYDY